MKKRFVLMVMIVLCLCQAKAQSFFQFYFLYDVVRHDVLLCIGNGEDIDVWVKLYDANSERYAVVHQDASTVTGVNGIAILCENPTYVGTTTRAYYNADNFFIISDQHGNVNLYNVDDVDN